MKKKTTYSSKVNEVKSNIINDITKAVATYTKGDNSYMISFNKAIFFADDPHISNEAIVSLDTKDNGEVRAYNAYDKAYYLEEIPLEILAIMMDKLLDSEAFAIL